MRVTYVSVRKNLPGAHPTGNHEKGQVQYIGKFLIFTDGRH